MRKYYGETESLLLSKQNEWMLFLEVHLGELNVRIIIAENAFNSLALLFYWIMFSCTYLFSSVSVHAYKLEPPNMFLEYKDLVQISHIKSKHLKEFKFKPGSF